MRIRIGMRFGFNALARLGRGDIRGEGAAPTDSLSVVVQRCPVPGSGALYAKVFAGLRPTLPLISQAQVGAARKGQPER